MNKFSADKSYSAKLYTAKLYTSKLYTSVQCQNLDRIAIENFSVPSYELMNRAAKAALDCLRNTWPHANPVLLLCGSGNNGGDGLVLAKLLKKIGVTVEVFLTTEPGLLKGDALRAYQDAMNEEVAVFQTSDTQRLQKSIQNCALIVDALLGTGSKGELRSTLCALVESVNASGKAVFALDLPTGICADTGRVLGAAIKAQVTLTFIGYKPGLLTGQAVDYVGELHCDDLNLEPAVFDSLTEQMEHMGNLQESFCYADLSYLFKARARASHKGSYGHVLLVGGDQGFGGAIALAGMAALRVGAGLVSVACHPDNAAMVTGLRPELMCSGLSKPAELEKLISRASVVALGPGLGQSAWSQGIFSRIIEDKKLKVVDADALNFLANNHHFSNQWILTPHPGEAARLLNIHTQAVNDNRFEASSDIQTRYGGICVLKGAGTVVQGNQCGVCLDGNPGMASGGMGDVLTGILAGLIAQFSNDISLEQITRLAVSLHSCAADKVASTQGERGMIASDVINQLHLMVNNSL